MKILNENLFFTSDTHFYHKNIMELSNRPWKTVKEMNEGIIQLWNDKVPPEATIFHLGDFAFTGNIKWVKELINSLNGSIHLIMGNHDYKNKFQRAIITNSFKSINDYLYIEVNDNILEHPQGIFLCHYPMLSWTHSNRGSWQLFGHIHSGPKSTSSEKNINIKSTQYDVGVDNNEYQPISYDEVKTIIDKQIENYKQNKK